MKILSNVVFFILGACFLVCVLSLALLQLAISQYLSIIFLMFTCAFGLFLNDYLITSKN